MPMRVAIYVFPEVEALDFAGPYEVFTTASRVHGRRHSSADAPFSTSSLADSPAPLKARAGLRLLPDHNFQSAPLPDIVIIPGGVVSDQLCNRALFEWLRKVVTSAKVIASVCTGSFILAKAGLLQGRSATTHWEDMADLRLQFPEVAVKEGVRWVDEGDIVTSAGIAAGIDMSLHLVARFAGRELAEATARQMEVPYRPEA